MSGKRAIPRSRYAGPGKDGGAGRFPLPVD